MSGAAAGSGVRPPPVRRSRRVATTRQVFGGIVAGWIALAGLAAVPYLVAGWTPGDAVFEAMSGVTTTGATVVRVPEQEPRWLLVHRSLTQWVGGASVLVMLAVALPYVRLGGLDALRGAVRVSASARTREVLRSLGAIYVGLTVVIGIAYGLAGMGWFDAVNHALTTASTGGFSTRQRSFDAFGPAVQWVAVLAMVASGASLTAYWRILTRRRLHQQGPELRWYLGTVVVAAVLVTLWNASEQGFTLLSVRHSLFTTASVTSTTGYWVTGVGGWVEPAQALLLVLMAVGGMGGSVSGGLKVDRVVALGSELRRDLAEQLHPHAVRPVRVGRRVLDASTTGTAAGFVVVYGAVSLAGVLAVALTGADLLTAGSVVQSAIGNVGPGLGAVAPPATADVLEPAARAVLVVVMLAGRVEVLPLLLALGNVGGVVARLSRPVGRRLPGMRGRGVST